MYENKEKLNIMICRRNVMLTHQTHHKYGASARDKHAEDDDDDDDRTRGKLFFACTCTQ